MANPDDENSEDGEAQQSNNENVVTDKTASHGIDNGGEDSGVDNESHKKSTGEEAQLSNNEIILTETTVSDGRDNGFEPTKTCELTDTRSTPTASKCKATKGTNVKLRCGVGNDANLRWLWKKEKAKVTTIRNSGELNGCPFTLNEKQQLSIDEMNDNCTGVYHCEVTGPNIDPYLLSGRLVCVDPMTTQGYNVSQQHNITTGMPAPYHTSTGEAIGLALLTTFGIGLLIILLIIGYCYIQKYVQKKRQRPDQRRQDEVEMVNLRSPVWCEVGPGPNYNKLEPVAVSGERGIV